MRRYIIKLLTKMLTDPVAIAIWVFTIFAIAIVVPTLFLNQYDASFWKSVLAGAHNSLLDILIISVLILWLTKKGEKRREIQRYGEEIDDLRHWESDIAARKLQGNIKRLNDTQISNINLSHCFLQGVDLTDANLQGSDLHGATLFEATLQGVNLKSANLEKADLRHTNLQKANLQGANLQGAKLEKADLRGADLKGANLHNATIVSVIWNDAIYDNSTVFPYDINKGDMNYQKSLKAR